ncbi:Aldo/keto reductase [Delitschia confertaspora ATCC 74209]|uniref:Aldo/keto reductase n=1 Tax=Delitschia confertaspora ATCC 74209 TaxID=1513339 RepID=A0A9P4JLY3_9PLEO|nr:Aldo/keto reductase [Delitschia confertaspora ATCC 74209]
MSAVSGIHGAKKPNPVIAEKDTNLEFVQPKNWIPSKNTLITYKGKNGDVHAPPFVIGAWPWGDKSTWHWKPEEFDEVKRAWQLCLANGANFIDTAQVYGSGESEEICGKLFQGLPRDSFIIQTKYYVVPQMVDILHPTTAPVKALEDTLKRMNLDYVDIYLVHGPIHMQSIATIAKGMAECVDKGMAKCIGVANYSIDEMLKIEEELAKYGVPLATNQCEYSVLRRLPELSGLLRICAERGIVFQSYSSLGQGRLTGKYTAEHKPPKSYRFSSYDMKDIEPIVAVLKTIAAKRQTSISAVALNYNLSRGISPLVGIRKMQQAQENLAALGWRLTDEEIGEIDRVSLKGYSTELWQRD